MSAKEVNRCNLLQQVEDGHLTQTEAADIIGVTDRQVRRLIKAYREHGSDGLAHGLRGQPGNRQLNQEIKDKAIRLVKERFSDFGPTFAAEKLEELHGVRIGHETLRGLTVAEGLWKPKKRKVNYHLRRERRACVGEMEQFDGCLHDWFEGRGEKCTLLASRDDANNHVVARFEEYEGTEPVMSFWKRYLESKGKPQSVYLDRHGTYKVNHKNALDDDEMITQFQRAMEELGIEVIHARSPQAKGRIENLFGTLQDRLVKELRLAGISNFTEANVFLKEVFLPKFNQRFEVTPASAKDVHWPVSTKEDLDQILSVQHERVVGNDFTARFKTRWLQLDKIQPTLVLPRSKVVVEERLDGSLRLRQKGRYLNFKILDEQPKPSPVPIALTSNPKPRGTTKPKPDHPWRNLTINRRKSNKPDISILQKTGHF